MPYNKEVAKKSPVTAALREAGYTLEEAADEFGVSFWHLADVARGRTHPQDEVIAGFARLTGEPLADYVAPELLAKPYNPGQATTLPRQ